MQQKSILSYRVDDFDLSKMLLMLSSVVFVGLVVLYISVLGVDKRENTYIDLSPVANKPEITTSDAYLQLEETAIAGDVQSLTLTVNTEGETVNGVDAIVSFNRDVVMVDRIIYGESFDQYKSDDHQEGVIKISAWNRDLVETFNGHGDVATIFFKKKSNNAAVFNFICHEGAKDDSNISMLGDDLINCEKTLGFSEVIASDADLTLVATDVMFQEVVAVGGSLTMPWKWTEGFATAGCEFRPPIRPYNLTAAPAGTGEVLLKWTRVSGATHYTVTYGEQWLDFDFGSSNIGDTDQFTVTGLKSGIAYYFVVTAVNNCASSGYSDGVRAVSGGSTSVTSVPGDKLISDDTYNWNYDEVTEEKGSEMGGDLEASLSAKETESVVVMQKKDKQDGTDDAVIYKEAEPELGVFARLLKGSSLFGLFLLLLVALLVIWMMKRGQKSEPDGTDDEHDVYGHDGQSESSQDRQAVQNDVEERIRNYDPAELDPKVELPIKGQPSADQIARPPFEGQTGYGESNKDTTIQFPNGF